MTYVRMIYLIPQYLYNTWFHDKSSDCTICAMFKGWWQGRRRQR